MRSGGAVVRCRPRRKRSYRTPPRSGGWPESRTTPSGATSSAVLCYLVEQRGASGAGRRPVSRTERPRASEPDEPPRGSSLPPRSGSRQKRPGRHRSGRRARASMRLGGVVLDGPAALARRAGFDLAAVDRLTVREVVAGHEPHGACDAGARCAEVGCERIARRTLAGPPAADDVVVPVLAEIFRSVHRVHGQSPQKAWCAALPLPGLCTLRCRFWSVPAHRVSYRGRPNPWEDLHQVSTNTRGTAPPAVTVSRGL